MSGTRMNAVDVLPPNYFERGEVIMWAILNALEWIDMNLKAWHKFTPSKILFRYFMTRYLQQPLKF